MDRYARTQEGFEKRLGRARKTMIYREQARNQQPHSTPARHLLSKQLRHSQSRPELDVKSPEVATFSSPSVLSKRTSKADLSFVSSISKDSGSSSKGKSEQYGGKELRKKKKSKNVTTDTLYAVMIFYEFVKELASISEEHSVLHSLLYLPNPSSLLLDQ